MVPPLFQHRTLAKPKDKGFRSPPQGGSGGKPCRMPVWHRVRGGYRSDRHPGAGRGVGRGKEARVARATKVALMGLAVGLAFTPTQAFAQLGTPTENIAVSGQPVAAPTASQVHVVLRSGADCYRKGDYELAARYLQQAKAGEANLGADEK